LVCRFLRADGLRHPSQHRSIMISQGKAEAIFPGMKFWKNCCPKNRAPGGTGLLSPTLLFRAENPSGWWRYLEPGSQAMRVNGAGEGAGPENAGRSGRAGAAAGLLAHHRGRGWTVTQAQARDAPGTLSQVSSHFRLPLTGSLPLKRPSEKPQVELCGRPSCLSPSRYGGRQGWPGKFRRFRNFRRGIL
jgi:hypothetical protein